MKGPRRDGLYRADGFSRQHRLSRRPSPKRCAQTKLRHRNLYWQAVSRSRRPTTIRSLSGPQEPVRRCRGPSLFIGRSRRHRREPDRVPMEKFNSDSPRTCGGLLSCACPNHPKLPIRSPACRQHHLHCRRCKTLGRFRPAFLAGSAKPPKMDQQQGLGGS
jgi:hypothetical protein